MIGQNQESKAGTRSGVGDGRLVGRAVGSRAVYVVSAGDRPAGELGPRAIIEPDRRGRNDEDEQKTEQDTSRDEGGQRPWRTSHTISGQRRR